MVRGRVVQVRQQVRDIQRRDGHRVHPLVLEHRLAAINEVGADGVGDLGHGNFLEGVVVRE